MYELNNFWLAIVLLSTNILEQCLHLYQGVTPYWVTPFIAILKELKLLKGDIKTNSYDEVKKAEKYDIIVSVVNDRYTTH